MKARDCQQGGREYARDENNPAAIENQALEIRAGFSVELTYVANDRIGIGWSETRQIQLLGSIGLFSDAVRVALCAPRRESRPRRHRAESPLNPNKEKEWMSRRRGTV